MTLGFTTRGSRFRLFCPSISEPNVGRLWQRLLRLWTWETIKNVPPPPNFLLSKSYSQHFESIHSPFLQFGAKFYADTLSCPVCLILWTQAWQTEHHTLVLNDILFNNRTSFSVIRRRKWFQLHLAVEVLEVAVVSSRGQSSNWSHNMRLWRSVLTFRLRPSCFLSSIG